MTREDVVRVLLEAYHGPGGIEEGTFAGDVLRACADGMAQLWSMEIDGLERRAFVSTATGDCLTMVCADRGVIRREGEDDETLRRRAIEHLARLPASGNEDDYREWCSGWRGLRGCPSWAWPGDGGQWILSLWGRTAENRPRQSWKRLRPSSAGNGPWGPMPG